MGNTMSAFIIFIFLFSVSAFAAEPPPFIEASAITDAMVMALSNAEIEKALPSYLELAPQDLSKEGTHPIFLLYAKQIGLKFIGAPAREGVTYNEAITYIPYVRVKGQQKIFNYMAQLHLDDMMPIYFGLRKYGYLKDLAKIEYLQRGLFIAHDPFTGQLLFDQTTVPVMRWDSAYFERNWEIFSKIIERPIISNLNGALICSVVHFQHESAKPITAYVELGDFGLPGLAGQRKGETLVVGLLDGLSFEGGVRYSSKYTLSAPVAAEECY